MTADVLIAGGGPAAYAVAAACASEGMRIIWVSGEDAAWKPTYSAWHDDLLRLGFGDLVSALWSDAEVVLSDDDRRMLGRPYALVDKVRLQAELAARIGNTPRILERVVAVEQASTYASVILTNGVRLRARVVVDATGSTPALARSGAPPESYQTAMGWVAEVDDHPWNPRHATFMDWRDAAVDGDPLGTDAPTFLYALPLPDGRVFLEETSLVRTGGMSEAVLEARLRHRLTRLGVHVRRVDEVERCKIAMDVPIPPRTMRVVPFGAAAGFIHPATGFSLVRSLTAATEVAAAMRAGLDEGGDPTQAEALAWAAMWPDDERRRRALHDFGARILAGLDAPSLRRFFAAFFAMPTERWSAYLAPTGDVHGVLGAMASTLYHGDVRTRLRLLGAGVSSPGALLSAAGI